jgi:5-(carboxyamino)imidazole ribonucleotide synthase
MLAEAAEKLGLSPTVFAETDRHPAAQVARRRVIGDPSRAEDLSRFLAAGETIVFENEFMDTNLLSRAAKTAGSEFRPSLRTLYALQDKLRQKQALERLAIPTAAYRAWEGDEPLQDWVARAMETFEDGAVFKWARQGYDGKGVFVAPPGDAAVAGALKFCRDGAAMGVPVMAEEKVPYRRELALVACRSVTGEFAAYPLVVSEQQDGVCARVYGPASLVGVAPEAESKALDYARRLGEAAGLVGTYALELFETADGRLLVNEVAPRVHNSGHFTQDAADVSQFENHWRAVLGMPLGSTRSAPAFAMVNLLGPDGLRFTSRKVELPPAPEPLRVHWYGKDDVQPRRKLGHVNARGDSPLALNGLLDSLEKYRREWAKSLAAQEPGKR